MLTVDAMEAYGADTKAALTRCMNKEDLYLKLVAKVPESPEFDALEKQIAAKDYGAAFDTAHGLKGILLNLAITPLADPVSEVTELLRAKTDTDYSGYLKTIREQKEKLTKLCNG